MFSRMKQAISKAKSSGVGWVTAKRSNHFGICQWYTDMALEEGLIGMSATNTSPLVAPTRAKEQVQIKHLGHVLCTNPQFLPIPRTEGLRDEPLLCFRAGRAAVRPVPLGHVHIRGGRGED